MTQSLSELLEKFHEIPDENFDPEVHIGDLKDKIDAIKWRIDTWEGEADVIETKWIAELLARRNSLRNAADRLKKYVFQQMDKNGWDELPGNMMRVKIQASSPSLDIPLPATAQAFLSHPKYIKQDITYSWLKETIKDDVDSEGNLPIPGATLKHGRHIRFYAVKGK